MMLLKILPPNLLADENIVAVAETLDVELQKLTEQTRLPLHLPRLNQLPHAVLDELAWQYQALFYEPENMDLETKRRIIANSIMQWRKVGTPYAVRQMLDNFAKGTEIEEWFDYGGEPYHFKLLIKRLQDLDDNGETILRLIDATKNVRSHLDAFDFNLTRPAPDEILYVAFAQILAGRLYHDLIHALTETQNLQTNSATLFTGGTIFNTNNSSADTQKLHSAFHHIQCGNILYNCAAPDDLWYELWLNWVKSLYDAWNAKIIYYTPDEPVDDFFEDNFEGDYLKLWISYHNSDLTRLMVFPNPRDDFTPADINNINVDGIFIKRGFLSDKIIRASLVKKSVWKINL